MKRAAVKPAPPATKTGMMNSVTPDVGVVLLPLVPAGLVADDVGNAPVTLSHLVPDGTAALLERMTSAH